MNTIIFTGICIYIICIIFMVNILSFPNFYQFLLFYRGMDRWIDIMQTVMTESCKVKKNKTNEMLGSLPLLGCLHFSFFPVEFDRNLIIIAFVK